MTREILTILIALTPTLEAHGALVVGIGLFKFSVVKAFLLTVLGTVAITAPLLWFWQAAARSLMHRFYVVNRFLTWLFGYTRARHADRFESVDPKERRTHLLKALALYVFVAIPGPLTGVWAASVAAYVFGVPFRYAFISIVLGALSVAAIDALLIAGVIELAIAL